MSRTAQDEIGEKETKVMVFKKGKKRGVGRGADIAKFQYQLETPLIAPQITNSYRSS